MKPYAVTFYNIDKTVAFTERFGNENEANWFRDRHWANNPQSGLIISLPYVF